MKAITCAIGAASCALSFGCNEPLKPVELIEELRVLGARVEVEAAPERAAPRPGERATVRWLVAAPEPLPSFDWSLEVCPATQASSGIPSCAGPAFAGATSTAPAAEPSLLLEVPADTPSDGRLLVQGSIGETPVALSFDLATATESNLNPTLEADALSLDGQSSPAADLISEGACARVPQLPAGSGDHELRLRLDEADRDALPTESDFDVARETLHVASFTTGGELERAFSFLNPSEAAREIAVNWSAPATAPAEGTLVRFFFVVRDLRGGSDWLERGVCVLP